MADPIGKYVTLYKGTPDNQVNMSIANEVDWSSFGSSTWQEVEVTLDADHKPRVCHAGLNSSQITTYKTIWTGLGLARRPKEGFSLITDSSVYEVLMTSNDRAQATNRTMTAIPIGVKPDDWDENYAIKYYQSSVQPSSGDIRQAVYYPATATWSASTQYYTNDNASWWYVKSGDNMLRFGVGDIGLTSSGFPSVGVLNNTINLSQLTQSPMFWTWLHDDTETIIMNQSVNNSYNFASLSNTSTGMPGGLFNNGQRNRYLFSTTYDSAWSTGYNTDEAKGMWRTNCRNNVKIKNSVCTQFGFVTQNGHRYFGIWVLVPTISDMIGFNKYANDAEGIPTTNRPSPLPPYSIHQYDTDLRIYNFDDPIPDTQAPQYMSIDFYGIEIDKIGIEIEEKEGTRPPDINPDLPAVPGWTPLKPILPTERSLGSLSGPNEPGFHVWDVTDVVYKRLLGNLWNWGSFSYNVVEQMNNDGYASNPLSSITQAPVTFVRSLVETVQESKNDPLAAIQFCFALPKYINTKVVSEGLRGSIKIASLDLGNNYPGLCCGKETYTKTFHIDCSGTATTQSYLDVAPYSTAEVYLPYIGMVQIDPADCANGSIDVEYSTCVVDGTISATIVCASELKGSNPTQYGPYVGNAAYRIPIAQKDANAFNRDMGYMKAIGTGLSGVFDVIKGSITTAAMSPGNLPQIAAQGRENVGIYARSGASMANQLVNSYLMPNVLKGSQLGTGSAIVSNTREIAVIISTPIPVYSDWKDSSLTGFSSGKIGKIESFGTGEQGRFVAYSYAKLEGIPATEAEIEEIKAILYGGVYQ